MNSNAPTSTAAFSCRPDAGFMEAMRESGALAISTYQAGKVIVVGMSGDSLHVLPRAFDKPMGMAVEGDRMAVATRNEIVHLVNARGLAAGYPRQPGVYDGFYVPRSVHFTGELDLHDMAWTEHGLTVVATRLSCIARIDDLYSVTPVWRPPFVTGTSVDDVCHLNGMAVAEGKVRYATAVGRTDSPRGWRDGRVGGGVLLSVPDGDEVAGGLSMPHSPRLIDGRLFLLNSGTGELAVADTARGGFEPVLRLPGFPRGLVRHGRHLFIGLSRLRQSRSFRGLPIESDGRELVSGVAVVELSSLRLTGLLSFTGDVEEIYDLAVLPGGRRPGLLGIADDAHQACLSLPDTVFWSRPTDGQDAAPGGPSRPGGRSGPAGAR